MGIGQRSIRTSRAHISTERINKKVFPATLKTLGDHIRLKRFEKGLLQAEMAAKLGVSSQLVQQWEMDRRTPMDDQWLALVNMLGLDVGLK